MAIERFLAAVPAEIRESWGSVSHLAYMGCHFSASGRGLSSLPKALPRGSMLLLDDQTPIQGHDPQLVAEQLTQVVEKFACCAVLLDFQRPVTREAVHVARHLLEALPCPTGTTPPYAQKPRCPVCLPPVPWPMTLNAYLAPWQGWEIWLELSSQGECITLTAKGALCARLPQIPSTKPFLDDNLHCHYAHVSREDGICFCLWRTEEDLAALEQEAAHMGVTKTLGLWQEMGDFPGNT